MADIFKLFDGSMGAGGAASVVDQSADSFSDVQAENLAVASIASGSDSVDLLVDYSDFANFVTFNSAESYVTVTADSILNSYPVGGTAADLQQFLGSLDGYQRFFLAGWPSWSGHLRLNPAVTAAYVSVADVGVQDGVARTSFVSPGTGSLSITGWVDCPPMTGSGDAQVIFQKLRLGSQDGCSMYLSGSSLYFRVTSGSTDVSVSGGLMGGPTFFAGVLDRTSTTGTVSMYVGSTGTFPSLTDTRTVQVGARFDLQSGSFLIGSGSIPQRTVRPFTGSLDSLSVWCVPQTATSLTSSFNRKVYSQPGLVGTWQFNDASPSTDASYASVVRDRSGHRLDGRIQGFSPSVLGSGSIIQDVPDPILSLSDPDVVSYIVEAQRSGSLYDRDNESLIFRLFPEAFTQADQTSVDVFQNFALTLARHFDRIKAYVTQLPNLRRVTLGSQTDQAPDELLEEVADCFGWKFDGSFASADSMRYFVGRNVLAGTSANDSLAVSLDQIRAQIWRRVLANLAYIYKTKGTAESVQALLRSYGVDSGFVRLKEYARRAEARVPTERVVAERSVYALRISGGSSVTSAAASPLVTGSSDISCEVRVRFPLSGDQELPVSSLSGAIVSLAGAGVSPLELWYSKGDVLSTTGTLFVTSSAGPVTLANLPIFDDRFVNVTVVRESITGSLGLYVTRASGGEITFATSSVAPIGTAGYPTPVDYSTVSLGSSSISPSLGEFWAQELRVWQSPLGPAEIADHAENFSSYGRDSSFLNSTLRLHWRLDDGSSAAPGGSISIIDSGLSNITGVGSKFSTSSLPFDKFLLDYAYIPSIDYGWNQQKVRVFDGSQIDPGDAYVDERTVSLEFNMYDALNEDISNVMTSYDELTSFIGLPVNRYREDYEGLRQMRETYFKRLQGPLRFRVFVDMLDFFDSSFSRMVERIIPARSDFKGDELIIESHMLERPKYQYQLRPIVEGLIDISGSIGIVDRGDDFD